MTPNEITPGDVIRVFARRTKWTPTDDLAFYGEPGTPFLGLPRNIPVYVSVTFTWDKVHGAYLAESWAKEYRRVRLGGPAFGAPQDDFIPGRFINPGVTFTSRGCPKNCPWCLVPKGEGRLREIPIQPGHIVQDNNLLACSQAHFERVCEMLSQQRKAAKFSGGLDIDYLTEWHVEQLKKIRVKELWVACDTEGALKKLDKVADLLSDFPIKKKRCYVLGGFDQMHPDNFESRCEAVLSKGFLPFAQLYHSPDHRVNYSPQWKALARKWSRPGIYRSKRVRK